jgi:hypothetical protein
MIESATSLFLHLTLCSTELLDHEPNKTFQEKDVLGMAVLPFIKFDFGVVLVEFMDCEQFFSKLVVG